MKFPTLLALVGALPLPAKSGHLPDWRKPLTTLFLALHESRRRQAARDLRRHQYLLDRYARPQGQEQAQERREADSGDTTSQDPRDAQLRSVFLP